MQRVGFSPPLTLEVSGGPYRPSIPCTSEGGVFAEVGVRSPPGYGWFSPAPAVLLDLTRWFVHQDRGLPVGNREITGRYLQPLARVAVE